MKKISGVLALCGLLVLGLAAAAIASGGVEGDAPSIKVSPQTIVLGKVDAVSVHTNIPASSVVPGSLYLDGASPTSVYVDNMGHIAAKFAVGDLELEPGEVTLTLTGDLENGDSFSATDVVRVK